MRVRDQRREWALLKALLTDQERLQRGVNPPKLKDDEVTPGREGVKVTV